MVGEEAHIVVIIQYLRVHIRTGVFIVLLMFEFSFQIPETRLQLTSSAPTDYLIAGVASRGEGS